jgi:hypothetical protein
LGGMPHAFKDDLPEINSRARSSAWIERHSPNPFFASRSGSRCFRLSRPFGSEDGYGEKSVNGKTRDLTFVRDCAEKGEGREFKEPFSACGRKSVHGKGLKISPGPFLFL